MFRSHFRNKILCLDCSLTFNLTHITCRFSLIWHTSLAGFSLIWHITCWIFLYLKYVTFWIFLYLTHVTCWIFSVSTQNMHFLKYHAALQSKFPVSKRQRCPNVSSKVWVSWDWLSNSQRCPMSCLRFELSVTKQWSNMFCVSSKVWVAWNRKNDQRCPIQI